MFVNSDEKIFMRGILMNPEWQLLTAQSHPSPVLPELSVVSPCTSPWGNRRFRMTARNTNRCLRMTARNTNRCFRMTARNTNRCFRMTARNTNRCFHMTARNTCGSDETAAPEKLWQKIPDTYTCKQQSTCIFTGCLEINRNKCNTYKCFLP